MYGRVSCASGGALYRVYEVMVMTQPPQGSAKAQAVPCLQPL